MIRTRARACDGKVRHDTQAGAQAHIAASTRAGVAWHRLQAYRCRHCSGWHVGHRPVPRKRR